jgi:hypothetical protein
MVLAAPHEKILISNIQTIMRLRKGFVLREVCGERVIMGEGLGAINFGKLLALNETAAWLWQQAQAMDDFTVESLAEKLCEEYDVTADEAKADVAEMIAEWQKVDVVE